jgi:uncharacterized DUF497 family protein
VEFEWDEKKRQINIEKHGIDFARAKEIWERKTINNPPRKRAGEPRCTTVGESEGRIIAVIWTPRGGNCRIISARRARRNERRDYRDATG